MAYSGKTNWQNNEIVEASDMNRIEQGISDVDAELGNVQGDVALHKAAAAPHSGHETPAGAQAKANTAEANAKAYTDAHEQKAAPHSGHETPEGAQAKVDTLAGEGNTKTVKQLSDEITSHTADYAAHGISHKNLLYNWDFRNPLNQSGFTSTTAAGYTIDGWRLAASGHTVEVVSDGIKITASSSAGLNLCFQQFIENFKEFEGETLTLSAHIVENTLTQGCNLRWNVSAGPAITGTGYFSTTFTPSSLSELYVGLQFADRVVDSGNYLIIDKIKLELSSVPTLANDPPADYGAVAVNVVQANIDAHRAESPSLVDNRIPVPTGADMNNYITPGNYRILDMATAATLINYPAIYGGTLEVWRYTSVFFIQRLTTSTTGVFYQRVCVNGDWGSWNMAYNVTNVTVSTSAPGSALAEGFQHQVY